MSRYSSISLSILLVAAATLMAQSIENELYVFWKPPIDDAGRPFQRFKHYRLYICNQPIKKNGDKVVCRGGELSFKDVDKDQLETEIVYRSSTPQDILYVRATTINQEQVESALSEQIVIPPKRMDRSVSLANSFFLKRASEHFAQTHAPEHLWDRCTEQEPECTSGSSQSNTVWLEFDFKHRYELQEASLFGDMDGTWQSWSWSLSYKVREGDSWRPAFTRVEARTNNWIRQGLGNIPARYVRVEIFGDPETTAVQARELEIRGVKHQDD